MSVSSRSILNSKKGCKDDEDFLDLQTGCPFWSSMPGEFLQNLPRLAGIQPGAKLRHDTG